jgi:hypothetical protein
MQAAGERVLVQVIRPAIDDAAAERLKRQTLAVLSGGTGRANSETLRALDRAVERAVAVAEPSGAYRFTPIQDVTPTGVETMFGTVKSARFARMARESSGGRRVAFAIASAGEALDEELARDMPLLDQFVLDAVGSELAEMVADIVEVRWKEEARVLRLEASMRMSPGYCDWLLEGQSVIFKAVDGGAVGVRLTSSFLMIPAKSVSSAAVLAEEVPLPVQCVTCARTDCPFRRAPYDEHVAETSTGEESQ